MAYEFYNAWMSISSTPSQKWKDDLQALINDQFENASNYVTIKFQNRTTQLYEDMNVRLTTPYKLRQISSIKDDYREILFKDNSLAVYLGERFYFNDYYWITIDTGKIEQPTTSCQVQRCNNTLKFYDNDGNYCETPCIAQSGNVYDVQQDKMIWIPSNTMKIFVKYDDIGRKIKSDMRFLLNGTAWRTGDVNMVKYVRNNNGYIEFFVTQDVVSVNDNLDLGIADYYNKKAIYTLTILNGDNIQVDINTPLQLGIKVEKTVDEITSPLSPTPSLVFSSSNENIATVSDTGLVTFLSTGLVTITCKLASDLIVLDTINITGVENVVDNYTYTLTGDKSVDNIIKLNSTATYTAKRFNNNIEIESEKFDFEIIANSTPSSKYNFTILSDNSCSIKCLGYPYTITLRAYLRSDRNIYVDKTIKLNGVI